MAKLGDKLKIEAAQQRSAYSSRLKIVKLDWPNKVPIKEEYFEVLPIKGIPSRHATAVILSYVGN